MKNIRLSLLGFLFCTAAFPARGADIVWSGGVDSNWNTGGNWVGGVAPGASDMALIEILSGPVVDSSFSTSATQIRVGNNANGLLTVQNGAMLTASGFLQVGYAGIGEVRIYDGASIRATGDANIGWSVGGNGTVSVDGTNSELRSNLLYVGRAGTGILHVRNGATARATGNANIGFLAGANGAATVQGTGSTLSGVLVQVGVTGTGNLTLTDGGRSTSSSHTIIAVNANSAGNVYINGAGSELISNAHLRVGGAGNGTLNVTAGGLARAVDTLIGYGAGSTGSVTVSGADSRLQNTGSYLIIGHNNTAVGSSSGSLTITDGGVVTNAGISWVGDRNGSSGTLDISGGGRFSSVDRISIAGSAGSTGAVIVSGAGSLMESNSEIHVARYANGSLTISDGATVRSAVEIDIGEFLGSTGTLNIGAADGDAGVAAGIIDAPSITFGAGTGRMVFNHTNDDFVLSSDISGNGTMDFLSGISTLSGNNTGFTGAVNVNGGILRVNGAMGAVSTTIDSGARFEGNSTIGNLTVNSGGTLAPGNSIGITNAVNAVFNAGSIYEVEVNSAGQSDLLNASGTVTINGGIVRVIPYPDYVTGVPYVIITAGGGILGTGFDGPETPAFVIANLSNDANNMYLTLSQNAGALLSVANTANQSAVTGALAGVSGNAAIDALAFSMDSDAARTGMDMLSGEIHASLSSSQMREQERLRAMALIRKPDIAAAKGDGVIWVQAFGAMSDVESDGNAAGVDERMGGVMAGVEKHLDEAHYGLAAGHSVNSVDVGRRNSEAFSKNYHVMAYGGADLPGMGLSLDGGASWTWHDNDTTRDIEVGNFNGTSRADYNAQSAQIFARLSRALHLGDTGLSPYIEGAYVYHQTDDFKESGTAGLSADDTANDAFFTTAGINAAHVIAGSDDKAVTVSGGVGWRRLIGKKDVNQNLSWRDEGGADFTVKGLPLDRDAFLLDAGLEANVASGIAASLHYAGSLSEDSQTHGLSIRANIKF